MHFWDSGTPISESRNIKEGGNTENHHCTCCPQVLTYLYKSPAIIFVSLQAVSFCVFSRVFSYQWEEGEGVGLLHFGQYEKTKIIVFKIKDYFANNKIHVIENFGNIKLEEENYLYSYTLSLILLTL